MMKFCFSCFLFFLFTLSGAQEPVLQAQYKIHKITVEDGLSHNRVNATVRDKEGFIWFATNEGLNRYDGYNFKVYEHKIGDSLSINHNIVRDVLCDSRGQLWVGSDSGLNLYNSNIDAFIDIKPHVDNQNLIWDIYEADNGIIWIGSSDGVWYIDPATNSLKRFNKIESLKGIEILKIIVDTKNRLWVCTGSTGVLMYDIKTEETVHYLHDENDINSISQNSVETVYEDSKGVMWFGTTDNGFFIFNEEEHNFTRYIVDKDIPTSGRVREIIEDPEGHLWLGTKAGLYLYKKGTSYGFYRYASEDNGYSELSQNSIYDIYIDNNDIMWIGTFVGGVNYIDLNQKKFTHYFAKENDNRFLNSSIVFSIFEDSKGNLWVGTEDGGANYLDRSKGTFTYFMHDPENDNTISSNNVKTFAEDNDGNIWIGTYQGSLDKYNPKTGKFVHYNHDPNDSTSICNNRVYILHVDSKGNLWVGTGKGLDLLKPNSNQFIHMLGEKYAYTYLPGEVIAVLEDANHTIWIGTLINGLLYYDADTKKFIHYKSNLIHKTVQSICEDFLGQMWVGGEQGVFCISREEGTIYNFTKEDGLPSNRVFRVINDTIGNIWISSTKGLCKFINGVYRPDSANFKIYTKEDGLQSTIFIPNSYTKSKSGELFFGGINGFNAFFPGQIKDNPYKPIIKITGLKIFNKEVGINQEVEGRIVLHKAINVTREIELTHKQKVFTIEFAALHFIEPGLNRYKYKLENFDKEWIETTADRRYATYTNLPGGEYTFKVIASNNDGLWNMDPVELKITIMPPFWKTWWFWIIVILQFIALVAVSFLMRIRNLNLQRRMLEQKVEERTKDLYETNLQLKEQTEILNNTNTQLEERQMQIEEQAEELEAQKNELEKNQGKILEQAAELEASNIHLKELNSTKDKFFSIIAHDLKNPFQSIIGFVGLLQLKYDVLSEEKKRKYVELTYSSTISLFQLLENLLTWSRTQLNTISFDRQLISMKNIIQDSFNLLSGNINKQLNFEVDCPDSLKVYADENMVKTILRNLITNAFKFTDNDGLITVKCENKDKFVEISVIDTGIGIKQEDIDKLFRIDESFSKPGIQGERGTGLGLLLCKEFVEKHGGKIWVESKPLKGAKFTFTIPNNKKTSV